IEDFQGLEDVNQVFEEGLRVKLKKEAKKIDERSTKRRKLAILPKSNSEQPSMRDMMQVLLRIEQNQANMATHLTRVDQRLSRIEQQLDIDEDEDQD
ncbi:hypothetical protein PIB30_113130, partial [Stylosanthes scabra]|nr:hypothetical protein [Stylosanthes scabra]